MGNMVAIDIQSLKRIQIEILKTVVDFCEKHNINYWLDFGTLLGAVRHKGYIPWDDDIDIGMLREDYDKFLRLFNAENERYKCYSYENNKEFLYKFCKVLDTKTILYEPDKTGSKLCVNIDVFPYDNVPNSKLAKKLFKKRDRYNVLITLQKHRGKVKGNFVRRFVVSLIKLFIKIFPQGSFIKKSIRNAKTFSKTEAEFVCDFTGTCDTYTYDKALFKEFINIEFEGQMYKIPKNYDKILTVKYGDYMILPPVEKRGSHHKFEAYMQS